WAWGRTGEGYAGRKPAMHAGPGSAEITAEHESIGLYRLALDPESAGAGAALAFTDNETNYRRLWGQPNRSRHLKDAFHDLVVEGRRDAVNPELQGTKAAWVIERTLRPGETAVVRLRLWSDPLAEGGPGFAEHDQTFAARLADADDFHASRAHPR